MLVGGGLCDCTQYCVPFADLSFVLPLNGDVLPLRFSAEFTGESERLPLGISLYIKRYSRWKEKREQSTAGHPSTIPVEERAARHRLGRKTSHEGDLHSICNGHGGLMQLDATLHFSSKCDCVYPLCRRKYFLPCWGK